MKYIQAFAGLANGSTWVSQNCLTNFYASRSLDFSLFKAKKVLNLILNLLESERLEFLFKTR